MHLTHEGAGAMKLGLPGSWHSHAVVILVIVVFHVALFYVIEERRPPRISNSDSLPMLTPVISEKGLRRGQALPSRALVVAAESQLTPPSRHWRFSPIDIWPSRAGWSATASEFTPVTEAQADPPEVQTPLRDPSPGSKRPSRPSYLRMIRWFRPEYPIEWALAGKEGSVRLDLRIDPQGQAVETDVTRRSGFPELDEAALRAANLWRFAPPLWKSRPVDVSAEVEVRFNFFSFGFSRLGEPLAESSPIVGDGGSGDRLAGVREHAVRRLITQLQSPSPQIASSGADELHTFAAAVRDWGPVTRTTYLGAVGEPEWRTYAVRREYRGDPPVASVAVRWELYRVEHTGRTSLWKVAFDRRGHMWAVKADVVSSGQAQ